MPTEREREAAACPLAFLREDVITYFVWKCLSPKKGAGSAHITGKGRRSKNELCGGILISISNISAFILKTNRR